MANPFKYGGEVSGYRFYDRKEDAKKLHRRLADGSTDVVLYAPRRYFRERHRLPTYSTVHSALKDLIDEGTVESDDAGYRLGDPMLTRYIRQSPARVFVAAEEPNGN